MLLKLSCLSGKKKNNADVQSGASESKAVCKRTRNSQKSKSQPNHVPSIHHIQNVAVHPSYLMLMLDVHAHAHPAYSCHMNVGPVFRRVIRLPPSTYN